MTQANDNGVTHFQRLDPSQIDVVLGSARPPRSVPAERKSRAGLWLTGLAAAAALAWGLEHEASAPVARPAASPPAAPLEAETPPVAVVNQAVSQVVNQATLVVINAPATAAPAKTSKPEEQAPAPPQGLVSAEYLAQFRAGATHAQTPAQRPYQIASVTIREWDGPNRYVARWRIYDNEIDQGSVCFNFPGDSIERRECRRAAQQYFKDQCRDWTRRAEKSRDRDTRDARTQLCAVASQFTP
ncbi:hypothetical protein [Pseudomonas massiliensis]|uniref:hypothetical protein n=1 Tax=Pseudomonas massiliensis TaxID=522492 RepID=UPI00058C07C0|nr:hypothetical protein [Pseudomonas massiliensis]